MDGFHKAEPFYVRAEVENILFANGTRPLHQENKLGSKKRSPESSAQNKFLCF